MKKNIGPIDRGIRAAVTIAIIVLYYTGYVKGYSGMLIRSAGVILIITAFIGYSPVYALFGLSTNKKEDSGQQ